MKHKRHFLLLTAAIFAAVNVGCQPDPDTLPNNTLPLSSYPDIDAPQPAPQDDNDSPPADYSDPNMWLQFGGDKSKDVDAFVIYPTLVKGNAPEDCPYSTFENTRSDATNYYRYAFRDLLAPHANAYYPLYRQSNVFNNCEGGSGDMGGLPKRDIYAAFEYYLKNVNKGERPFILIGFSQGAHMVWFIAQEYLRDNPEYNKLHIISYAIGSPGRPWNVSNPNPAVSFSRRFDDIHTITQWNSYTENDTNCTDSFLGVRGISGDITNPITWTTDEDWHDVTENEHLKNSTRITSARAYYRPGSSSRSQGVGILLVKKTGGSNKEGCAGTDRLYMGEHNNDIPFFKESIIANIGHRIAAWKAAYPGGTSVKEPERVVR